LQRNTIARQFDARITTQVFLVRSIAAQRRIPIYVYEIQVWQKLKIGRRRWIQQRKTQIASNRPRSIHSERDSNEHEVEASSYDPFNRVKTHHRTISLPVNLIWRVFLDKSPWQRTTLKQFSSKKI